MRQFYNQEKKDYVRDLYKNGLSLRLIARKEKINYITAFRWCKDILRNKSEAHKGKIPKNIKIFLKARKNYKLTEEDRRKMSEAQKRIGTIPPSQKGKVPWNYVGATKLAERIRKCWKYKEWRSKVFERDLYTCVKCKAKGVYIEADHYPIAFAEIIKALVIKTLEEALLCETLWNIDNGRTLCLPCHKLTPNYLRGRG